MSIVSRARLGIFRKYEIPNLEGRNGEKKWCCIHTYSILIHVYGTQPNLTCSLFSCACVFSLRCLEFVCVLFTEYFLATTPILHLHHKVTVNFIVFGISHVFYVYENKKVQAVDMNNTHAVDSRYLALRHSQIHISACDAQLTAHNIFHPYIMFIVPIAD